MRNSNNSKEAQGVVTAQELQEQFNVATKEFLTWFSLTDLKKSVDELLIGWVGSDYFELKNSAKHAAKTLDFFSKLQEFLAIAEKEKNSKEVNVLLVSKIMNTRFDHNYKKSKKYFKYTLKYFLESENANDSTTRSNVLYHIALLKKYYKKISKITSQIDREIELQLCCNTNATAN